MRVLPVLTLLLALLVAATTHDIQKRQTRRLRARPGLRRRNPNNNNIAREVSDPTPPGKRIVCYYTNWSVYRSGIAKFLPQHINPHLCTHLVYAFAGLTDEYAMTPFDAYQDIEKKGYSQFNLLKQYNDKLRTLIAVGGWEEGSGRFSELVSFPKAREVFINSTIKHIRRYNFDGLDLDWEYPASRSGSSPDDKQNYALLVHELRAAFEKESRLSGKPRLLLTMAVPAGQTYIDRGYDIPSLNKDLDFFNILNYDYTTSVDPMVGNHAPLVALPGTTEYEDAYQLNVDWTVNHYISLGAAKNKLVIGIPTYGRSFTLASPTKHEFGDPAIGPATPGKYTKEKGFLAFYEVCELMANEGWEAQKPYPRTVGPYAHKGDEWVGYDDEGMVTTKAEYVRETGLGGIMFWSLDTDDFHGICNGQKYLLVESGKAALLSEPLGNSLDTKRERQPLVLPITPAPPVTPSPLAAFKCKAEGFFPNPDDCHQYFWCLTDAGDAHTFTCPAALVFSRRVGGCDHATKSSCKETKNRGGLAAAEKKVEIPTTTPFPEFDYDYYYYYDDDDYQDKPVVDTALSSTAPQADTSRNNVASRTSTVNSRGPQFTRTEVAAEAAADAAAEAAAKAAAEAAAEAAAKAAADAAAEAAADAAGNRQRNRPQYSAIQRERAQGAVADAAVESSAPGGRNARPQYTSIQRSRPSTEAPDYADYDTGVTPGSRLNYVTIERQRPNTVDTDLQIADQESATESGLQYVTLRRSSNRATTASSQSADDANVPKLIAIDSDSFRQRPERVERTTELKTTTTTTTTPRPARIVVPQSLLEPAKPSVIHLLNLDPRRRQSTRTQQRGPVVDAVERVRQPSTTRTDTNLPIDEYSDALLEEYYYDYDEIPATEGAVVNAAETTPASAVPVSEAAKSVIDDSIVDENIRVSAGAEAAENALVAGTDVTTSRSTINILADFPALITTALPEALVLRNDTAAKTLEDPREEAVDPEVTTQLSVAAEEDNAAAAVTEQQQQEETTTIRRRIPQLPRRANRPRTPPAGGSTPTGGAGQQTDRRRPKLPPRPTNRFSSNRPGSTNTENTTRRSSFRPSSQRNQHEDRTSNRSQNRFRPRQQIVEAEATSERSVTRFRNRQNSENRFRLTPIAVTTSVPVTPTRPIRNRPTVNDRKRARPNFIRFRNRDETTEPELPTTEHPVVSDAEPAIGKDAETVTQREVIEEPVTSTDLFAAIFGDPEEIASTSPQPVDHRIIAEQISDVIVEDKSVPVQHTSPASEVTINFNDLFTPTTSLQELVGEIVTTGMVTTASKPRTAAPTTTSTTAAPPPPPTTTTTTTTTTSVFTTSARRRVPPTLRTSPATLAPSHIPERTGTRSFTRIPEPSPSTARPSPRRGGRPPKPRPTTWRPPTQIADYVYDDYFYDDITGALGGTLGELAELTAKALLLPGGKVQCYDTGYFAHPESCKKFISCSKTVRGAVRGWVYTCPQNLVFDPVGGMCNWAEAVDCEAPVVV
uniref:Mucin-5AC-like n=1 Tax=Hirondellea gigas TaxID=1518452 RepID=A0A2P2I1P3_9CRUS